MISCEMHPEDLPPSTEEDPELGDIAKLEHLAQDIEARFGGWQPAERRRVRTAYFNDLKRRVSEGECPQIERTCSEGCQVFLLQCHKNPDTFKHMAQQTDTHPYPIHRANISFDQSAGWQDDDVIAYAELAKNMLSMGCKNIPDFELEERVLSSNNNLAFMLLNLGNLDREPRLSGKQKVPPLLVVDGTCTILPTLP